MTLALFDKQFQLSDADIQGIIDQYASKQAGYSKDSGKTLGIHATIRPAFGMLHWGEMTPAQRQGEVLAYISEDFAVAQQESVGKNPVDYLLDRALDPLDPMREVYRVVLKTAGAQIEGNSIRLTDHLQKKIK